MIALMRATLSASCGGHRRVERAVRIGCITARGVLRLAPHRSAVAGVKQAYGTQRLRRESGKITTEAETGRWGRRTCGA
jgi:hypothetical protein